MVGIVAAVDGGKVVDTSMGMTPLAGLMMGTRSGDIDPSIPGYLMKCTGMTSEEMDHVLNKQSGLEGVSGVSSDKRDLDVAVEADIKRAILASEMFNYDIKKYVGAYAAAMGGVDCIVFTGGIGENDNGVREDVCSNMEFLGIAIDEQKNLLRGMDVNDITAEGARVKVLVIATNEELMIARDTAAIVSAL